MSVIIECAFCKGKGKDPFELLSKLATCQVCGGRGTVKVDDSHIKCVYCLGTGVFPYGSRLTCTVCGGKGVVAIKGKNEVCKDCKGTGRSRVSGLSCITCKGKGVVLIETTDEVSIGGRPLPIVCPGCKHKWGYVYKYNYCHYCGTDLRVKQGGEIE
jgi:DnaJ-class molecular chaperone